MTDMRRLRLLHAIGVDHNLWVLSIRVALLSPSSSDAGAQ